MPVEIKELHIRVAVNAKPPPQPGAKAAAAGAKPPQASADKDAIVAECVDQVLELLQARKQR